MRVGSHFDGKGASRYSGNGRERGGGGGGGGGGVGSLGKISAFSGGGGFGAKSSKGKGGAMAAAIWQGEHDLSGFEEELGEFGAGEFDGEGGDETPRAPITSESLPEHRRQQKQSQQYQSPQRSRP